MIEDFIDVEDYIYPLTVVRDRYSGTYSGGVYTAWNLDCFEIPMDIALSDVTCMEFWDNEDIQNNYIIGKGDTVEEAIADLYIKLEGNTQNNEKQENKEELKPCPFCVSTSLKVESKHNGTHYYSGTHSATVRCNKCHARGSTASCEVEKGKYHADKDTVQRATELWNTRFEQE